MSSEHLQGLNERFAVPNHVVFEEGRGGLPVARIRNEHASATVVLQGAHVTSFQPDGQEEVLWVSQDAVYKSGKAIRGGIPVCWPWFADHPTDSSKPAHGFVRAADWSVVSTEAGADGSTVLKLGIQDSAESRELFPHAFSCELTVVVGRNLGVDLAVLNTGSTSFSCGGALHSYFTINNCATVRVQGLAGKSYIDKVDGLEVKTQEGPIQIEGETDWIYLDTVDSVIVADPDLGRRIRIEKTGSNTTVVWNPGPEKSAGMKDFGDNEFHGMICVEAANADKDVAIVEPGGTHHLGTVISLELGE